MTEAADKDRVQYTNDQARAITTVGESLCVTAGAGSGKTTVLVERYLHLIEAGGLDVDSIVAITFTEKAANQMKEKIREKIGARVTAAESRTEREAWERRSRQIGSAWIHTIHGFCTRLLKENPVEAGVDPRFTMLDETETLLLNHRIIADFINDRLNQDAETMVRLLTDYGLRTVQDMLTSLLNEREAVRLWWDFYLENNDNQILAPLRKRAEADLDRLRSELDSVACSDPGDRLEQLRQAVLETLPPSPITGENLDFLSTGIKLGQGSKKKWGDGPFARAKEILVAIRVRAGQLVSLYDQKRTARDLTLLRALLLEFRLLHDRYRQEKSSRGLVDFEDLLILARDLVTQNPAVRHKYRARIGTVLIDELQDTDPLQMAIVDSICGPDKIPIFGVGDAKQSIYSFRRADVAVFQRFQERIGRHNPDAVIPLSKNFRSQDAILDFINALFKKILSARQQGETDICFDGLEPHKKRVTQDHFVETFFIKSQPGETRAQSIREDEAAWMAARIEAMVDGGEPRILEGEGEIRPVHFGDIAILFRAMSDVKIYEAALRARGIPFTVVSGTGFFHKQEILDVLNILKLVLYPEDEEALAGILRCPVIGVRDDTLFFMTRGRSLSQGLRDAESVEGIDDQERAILRRARQLIGQLRSLRDRVRVPELIGRFLEATAYPALLLTDPIHGHQRCANLKKLMDLARRFGSRAFFGLADFVDYVEELRKRDTREGQSAIDEEANDTVRILTVHKAKGLEFPVVFLPDLGRSSGGRSGPLAIDPALGIGMMTPDGKGGLQDTAIRSFMTAEKKAADLAEEKRLFYVACTRAKDFLLLSGEIGFSKSTNKESGKRVDWLKEALEITEENYRAPIPYEGGILVPAPAVQAAAPTSANQPDTWAAKYPQFLRGEPVPAAPRASAASLIQQVEAAPAPSAATRVTVSELLLYRRCPKGYELAKGLGIGEPKRKDPLPPEPGGGRALGSLVHGILERWDLDPGSLDETLGKQLAGAGLSGGVGRKIGDGAKALIEAFSATPAAREIRSAVDVYAEVPFTIKFDFFCLEGVIDKLYRRIDGGLTLIDYKTDRIARKDVPAKADSYRFQLAVYGLAAERLFGEPVEMKLVFLYPGITCPIDANSRATEKEIRSLVEQIRSAGDFPMNREHCPRCGYWGPFCKAAAR